MVGLHKEHDVHKDKRTSTGGTHERGKKSDNRQHGRPTATGGDTKREGQQRISFRSIALQCVRSVRRTYDNAGQCRNVEVAVGREANKNGHQTQGQGRNKQTANLHNDSNASNDERGQQGERPDQPAYKDIRIQGYHQSSRGELHKNVRRRRHSKKSSVFYRPVRFHRVVLDIIQEHPGEDRKLEEEFATQSE